MIKQVLIDLLIASSNAVVSVRMATWTGHKTNTLTALKTILLLRDVLCHSPAVEILQTLM